MPKRIEPGEVSDEKRDKRQVRALCTDVSYELFAVVQKAAAFARQSQREYVEGLIRQALVARGLLPPEGEALAHVKDGKLGRILTDSEVEHGQE